MPRIIDNRTSYDQTVRIFDSFYDTEIVVNGNEYDIVNGYLKEVCGNKQTAANFSAMLFKISQETNIDALTLLEKLKGVTSKMQMNKIVAYYLNTFRSKTALYGVSSVLTPNQFIQRNIVL